MLQREAKELDHEGVPDAILDLEALRELKKRVNHLESEHHAEDLFIIEHLLYFDEESLQDSSQLGHGYLVELFAFDQGFDKVRRLQVLLDAVEYARGVDRAVMAGLLAPHSRDLFFEHVVGLDFVYFHEYLYVVVKQRKDKDVLFLHDQELNISGAYVRKNLVVFDELHYLCERDQVAGHAGRCQSMANQLTTPLRVELCGHRSEFGLGEECNFVVTAFVIPDHFLNQLEGGIVSGDDGEHCLHFYLFDMQTFVGENLVSVDLVVAVMRMREFVVRSNLKLAAYFLISYRL
jgi:hypothetical protein